jgi:tetratricopeptide (TPR) repeat protein
MTIFQKAILLSVLSGVVMACSDPKKNVADRHFDEGNFDQAVVVYSETLKSKPNDVVTLYNRGRANEEMGEIENAISDFEDALVKDPNNFQVLLSLSNIHLQQKNFEKAMLFATKAEEIPGAPALASFLKARALHQLGMPEDALKAYGNAIQIDKDFGQAYLNRGMLKIALKRNKSACEDFKMASVLDYPGAAESFKKYCK